MTRTFQGHWLTRRHINYGLNEEKYYQKNPSVIYSAVSYTHLTLPTNREV